MRHFVRFSALALIHGTLATALVAQEPGPAAGPLPTELIRQMTLDEKAAQLVMPWIGGGYEAWDSPAFTRISVWVDSLKVGGVIISIGSPTEVAARLNHLQRLARLPLLVASDLEGGSSFRLTGGTGFPTNMGVGASGSEADAYDMGRVIAEEGRRVGIHVTFSPVADVNNNPANPIINTRSFGGDPALVARLVAAQVRGTQDAGMVATAKHFPGHGDTGTDSHLALPVVDADWERLRTVELVPFKAAIDAGVGMVMSAHIALPRIDSGRTRPATLVPEILTGILRDSLGFTGMIVTDALDMAGVVKAYGPAEAAVRALLAGSDILLQPTDPVIAVRAVSQAVRDGRVSEARLDRSVLRVLELKQRLGLFQRRTVDLDSVGYAVGSRPFQEAARGASARALVLLKDSTAIIDSLARGPRRIALVTYGEANASTVGAVLTSELRRQGHDVSAFRLYPASGPASYDSAATLLAQAPYRLVAVSVRARESKGGITMPDPLSALIGRAGPSTMVVSFGSPYLISQVPSLPGYLLAWITNPLTEEAVAAALAGAPITGRLPVEIPPAWPIGAGMSRRATP